MARGTHDEGPAQARHHLACRLPPRRPVLLPCPGGLQQIECGGGAVPLRTVQPPDSGQGCSWELGRACVPWVVPGGCQTWHGDFGGVVRSC